MTVTASGPCRNPVPRRVTIAVVAVISFGVAAVGCTGGDTSTGSSSTTRPGPSRSSTTLAADDLADRSPATDLTTEIGRFQPSKGDERIYLLVAPDITDKELVTAARAWHQSDPQADLHFLDDDAEIHAILLRLVQAERGDAAPSPNAWVAAHQVARLQRFLNVARGKEWKLGRGTSVDETRTLAEFD